MLLYMVDLKPMIAWLNTVVASWMRQRHISLCGREYLRSCEGTFCPFSAFSNFFIYRLYDKNKQKAYKRAPLILWIVGSLFIYNGHRIASCTQQGITITGCAWWNHHPHPLTINNWYQAMKDMYVCILEIASNRSLASYILKYYRLHAT